MITRLAQRVDEATRISLVVTVACSLILLMIPMLFWLIRQHPYDMYTRFYDYEIKMTSFEITDDMIFFRDTEGGRGTVLAAPLEYFPQTDFTDENTREIFNRLALLNNYYGRMLLPIVLLMFFISCVTILSLSGLLAGMMGLGRKMTHQIPISKRLRIFAVCFWLPAIPSMIIGFIIPVFHFFIYQLLLGFLVWRVQKVL